MTVFHVILQHVGQCGWHNATCPHPTVALAQDRYERWWGFCEIHARTVSWGVINGGDVDTCAADPLAIDVTDEPEAEHRPDPLPKGGIYY